MPQACQKLGGGCHEGWITCTPSAWSPKEYRESHSKETPDCSKHKGPLHFQGSLTYT